MSPVELFTVAARAGRRSRSPTSTRERLAGLQFGAYRRSSRSSAPTATRSTATSSSRSTSTRRSRYPLAFLIHGGPQGSFDDHWHYRWNPQVYAAHGYATVMVDFHGSTGYGQAFTDAINGDWGGAPLRGPDEGPRPRRWRLTPGSTPSAMAALGASYGGYMINWIQGHTDRFKALVCHDGNLDEHMAYFDTEELWFPEWEHGGHALGQPRGLPQALPGRARRRTGRRPSWWCTAARTSGSSRRRAWPPSTPCSGSGRPVPPALLPGREPLGAQAAELDPVARGGARVDGPLDRCLRRVSRGRPGGASLSDARGALTRQRVPVPAGSRPRFRGRERPGGRPPRWCLDGARDRAGNVIERQPKCERRHRKSRVVP